MSYWLKMIGSTDRPLGEHPFTERPSLKRQVRFPKDQFPGRLIGKGDWLVYYAVGGWKRIFAVVQLTGDPERDVPSGDAEVDRRWPHAAAVALAPEHVDSLSFAPELRSVSKSLQAEIHQGVSHLPMGEPEFQRAREALRKARAGLRS